MRAGHDMRIHFRRSTDVERAIILCDLGFGIVICDVMRNANVAFSLRGWHEPALLFCFFLFRLGGFPRGGVPLAIGGENVPA